MPICRCCESDVDNDPRWWDEELQLCDECKNITIPMVRMYLAVYGKSE